MKIDGVNHKGCYREQFIESWRSYVGKASATRATDALPLGLVARAGSGR